MQNYSRIYDYIKEYQSLVYSTYGKHAPAYLVTYLHLNKETTVWDDDTLFGGSYEPIGELSGVKYNKYMLLPVYYLEEVIYTQSGEEQGVVNISETHIVIPSTYGFTPLVHDLIKFTNYPDDQYNDTLYTVTGIEHGEHMPVYFWKLKLINEQTITLSQAEDHIENTYTFYDYDKKLHETSHSITMTRLLSKNESIRSNLKGLFDENSGLYFV